MQIKPALLHLQQMLHLDLHLVDPPLPSHIPGISLSHHCNPTARTPPTQPPRLRLAHEHDVLHLPTSPDHRRRASAPREAPLPRRTRWLRPSARASEEAAECPTWCRRWTGPQRQRPSRRRACDSLHLFRRADLTHARLLLASPAPAILAVAVEDTICGSGGRRRSRCWREEEEDQQPAPTGGGHTSPATRQIRVARRSSSA